MFIYDGAMIVLSICQRPLTHLCSSTGSALLPEANRGRSAFNGRSACSLVGCRRWASLDPSGTFEKSGFRNQADASPWRVGQS